MAALRVSETLRARLRPSSTSSGLPEAADRSWSSRSALAAQHSGITSAGVYGLRQQT
jgi:hypothetical protein